MATKFWCAYSSIQVAGSYLSLPHDLQASVKQIDHVPDVKSWKASEEWYLTNQAGPQFAALNGDINFIHLHPIFARLFGFKSNIAHGTYLVSKALAAMQTGEFTILGSPVSTSYAAGCLQFED